MSRSMSSYPTTPGWLDSGMETSVLYHSLENKNMLATLTLPISDSGLHLHEQSLACMAVNWSV